MVFIHDDRLWSCPQCGLELRLIPDGVGTRVEVLKQGTVPVDEHQMGGPLPAPDHLKLVCERIARGEL